MSGHLVHRIFECSLLLALLCAATIGICAFLILLARLRNRDGESRAQSATKRLFVLSAIGFCLAVGVAWVSARHELKASNGPDAESRGLHILIKPVEEALEHKREAERLRHLASLEPIDAHTHINAGSPEFLAMLEKLHMHVLDILYVDDTSPYRKSLEREKNDALQFIASSGGRATLCTTFDPFPFREIDFAQKSIDSLNHDFAHGAVAAKIWKNIGMEIKDPSGKYLLPDDLIFQPIYRDIAEHKKALILHAAAVDAAWQPHISDPHSSKYFASEPQWNMWTKPDAPRKKDILDARDRLLAENPDLSVVGAHLGSMEAQLDELGTRLDRYPNFAIDVAARVHHLTLLPRETVQAFIMKYQDRVLYGTDLSFSARDNPQSAAHIWENTYLLEWRYFSTNDKFSYWGREVQGLGLPNSVLRKLYRENAMKWIPGIAGDAH